MENRKKRKSKNKNNQNTKTNTTTENTEVLNNIADNKAEQTTAENQSASEVKTEAKIQSIQPKNEEKTSENTKTTQSLDSMIGKDVKDFSADHVKGIAINAAKILLPVAACAIVIAVIISYASSQKAQVVDNTVDNGESGYAAGVAALNEEPLAENAYVNVNDMMNAFYSALARGDMDTVRSIKDYNSDKEIIAYEKKSEFIESYDNIKCYTKPGIEENSYFVYVTYDVKIRDIDTEAPGLNAFYVYTSEDGSLMIDGDTEENIKAAFKLVTNQDDVVDLYNKINVDYNEAIASDEALDQFLNELPQVLKESVGVELAKLETQDETADTPPTETEAAETTAVEPEQTQPSQEEVPPEPEQPLENKTVNQIVRTTDTVNVRSSDSEEADKIGKAQAGTELTRIEERINGWSKVIFEDKEAYIKSDYLEVLTAEVTVEPIGTITATTNVNVRSQANQESTKIGTAQAGSSYDLIEDQGEWFKINYNGTTGFVKAEFFDR